VPYLYVGFLSHLFQLSNTLTTRLRFALFKVENGWTRQSLSEVENLYYRRHMSVTSTPSKKGGLLTPPDKHSWSRTPTSNSHATPSSAQPYGQLIGSLDNSTYAEFWNRLDTTRHSPNQSNTGHMQTADGSRPTAADTVLPDASAEKNSKTVPLPQPTNSVPESVPMKASDMPRAPFTPDLPHAEKHTVDNASANDSIPSDFHPSKRLKQDTS